MESRGRTFVGPIASRAFSSAANLNAPMMFVRF
jgi:hypothetical protein